MKNKIIILVSIFTLMILFSQSAVADWVCFADGEEITVSGRAGETCDSQCCAICLTPPLCGALCVCDGTTGGAVDIDPPIVTINSPVAGQSFNTSDILLNISLDEKAEFIWRALDDDRRLSIMDRDTKESTFLYKRVKDGHHTLFVQARDRAGNFGLANVSFFVDSTEPKIRDVQPEDEEFLPGTTTFLIEYDEVVSVDVTLFYGVPGSLASMTVPGCGVGKRQECSVDVDLTSLDGEEIEYYFTIDDGLSVIESEHFTSIVDGTLPVITLLSPVEDALYATGKVYANVTLDGPVAELEYLDDIGKGTPRFKRLCRNCDSVEKRLNLKDGFHQFQVRATDFAGNEALYGISFFVDTKAPKISKQFPANKKYGSGLFTVEFSEVDLDHVTLHYKGENESAYTNVTNSSCPAVDSRGKGSCSVFVPLGAYEGEQVEFYFSVSDRLQTTDARKPQVFTVDTIIPELNISSPVEGFVYDERRVDFTVGISEEADLTYSIDGGVKWKRLCNNCEAYDRSRTMSEGNNSILIRATDDAGNERIEARTFSIVS